MWKVNLMSSVIAKEGSLWRVKCGDLILEFSLDEKLGIVLDRFENLSAERAVSYLSEKISLLPVDEGGERCFSLVYETAEKVIFAGKEILTLTIEISSRVFEYTFYLMVFPDTSVVRYYFDVKALEEGRKMPIQPLFYKIKMDNPNHLYTLSYFHGGRAAYDHGERENFSLGTGWAPSKVEISSIKTSEYVPIALFKRNEYPFDAFMIQMDYIANWSFSAQRNAMRQQPEIFSFGFQIDDGRAYEFKRNEKIHTPAITLTVYAGDDDNLMKRLYDWQYSFMWDYTNRDYFAKTRSIGPWVSCTRNLHEQFAYRTAVVSMEAINLLVLGFDMLWDDAGWSACDGWPISGYNSVFFNNYEGPDFSMNQRFLKKCGKGWLLWFAGKPSPQIMEQKSGAWGEFEWRTDAVYLDGIADEQKFRKEIETYLNASPERSFHTCSGGSTYSHTFDIVRWSNYNYLADAGRGPAANYYFSYFEYPDKWGDVLPFLGELAFTNDFATICPEENVVQKIEDVRYLPEFARAGLTAVPFPGEAFCAEDERKVRTDLTLYGYFLEKGIAGRFSYAYHPLVWGDKEIYYLQRTSRDLLRACIVLKRRPAGKTVVYPKALKDEELYSVSFMYSENKELRTGKELKERGVTLENTRAGELIFFNLDDHPIDESATKKLKPTRRTKSLTVYKREENNAGVSGIALYWPQETEVERYEIFKDGKRLFLLNRCGYIFDVNGCIDSEYDVLAERSGVLLAGGRAEKLGGGRRIYSALGDYGRHTINGLWEAEYSKGGKTFEPMTFIPPQNTPYADYGGTPNQEGGIMGYYQGGKCGRVGHAFMQASSDAYAARVFVCPSTGKVNVCARAVKEWYHLTEGSDLEFFATLNGERLCEPIKIAKGDVYGGVFRRDMYVKKGDKIAFVLGKTEAEGEQPVPFEHHAALVGCIPVITYLEKDRQENFYDKFVPQNPGKQIFAEFCVPTGVYKICMRFRDEGRIIDESLLNVYINDLLTEKDLDVVQTSRGKGRCVRTTRYVVPKDGKINVAVKAVKGLAYVESIEVSSESDEILRLNCGGRDFVDWSGALWSGDESTVRKISYREGEVSGAAPTLFDRGLYLTAAEAERIEYTFGLENGLYFVHLKFLEDGMENHAFEVFLNGQIVCSIENLEESAGGKRTAADRRFENIAVTEGELTVCLKGIDGKKAILQAIEIGR